LARLAKPYRLQGMEMVRGLYPSRGISAAAGLVSNVLDLAKYDVAIDGHTLVRAETQERAWTPASTPEGKKLPYGLGWFVQSDEGSAGDVIRSPFTNSFLRIFVREASLGRALPDPRWWQPSDRFNAEIEQLATQTGSYRYGAERASHELLTRWLDERRRAAQP
jgi:hypothetical protein